MQIKIDKTIPGDKWEFNQEVAQVFDNMLERSIPQYQVMRQACFDLAKKPITPNSTILDLGCSKGEALRQFVDTYGESCRYIGIDISEPMLQFAKESFKDTKAKIEFYNQDLRKEFPVAHAKVILSILTIQFVPIEYRLQIIDNIYRTLLPGGYFIFVEKILGNSAMLDNSFVDIYLNLKKSNGYTQEQIDRKRLSLEGVLVPVTAKWNEDMLKSVGFREIDCFWRWMNFAGWVAIK